MSLPAAHDARAIRAYVAQLFKRHPQPCHEAIMQAGQSQRRRTLADLHGELMFASRAEHFTALVDDAYDNDQLSDCYRELLPLLQSYEWNIRAATGLSQLIQMIEQAGAPTKIDSLHLTFRELGDTTKSKVEQATASIETDRAIYVITLDAAADPSAFRAAFTDARARKSENGLSLPKYNEDLIGSVSRVVYVGSSCATENAAGKTRKNTVCSRLVQHLAGVKGTYALNLGGWATNIDGGIIVDIYNFPAETPRDVVVAVEDALSRDLNPICGRRGIQR